MKAFSDCERRRGEQCVSCVVSHSHDCKPGQEVNVSKCWRMCEENEHFLQCPKCKSGLWFDIRNAMPGKKEDIFYCPECDENVIRSSGIQSIERLGKLLKENKAIIREYEDLDNRSGLTPRSNDTLNSARHEVKRIKKMITELAEKSF